MGIEIGIIDYEIVVLWDVPLQPIVSCAKSEKFLAGSVVCQLFWGHVVGLQHDLEQSFAMPASLHRLMHIKIEHTQGLDFFDLAAHASVE